MTGFGERKPVKERKGGLGRIVRPPGTLHHDFQRFGSGLLGHAPAQQKGERSKAGQTRQELSTSHHSSASRKPRLRGRENLGRDLALGPLLLFYFSPRIFQSNRAIEYRFAECRVGIDAEVSEPLELIAIAGFRLCE